MGNDDIIATLIWFIELDYDQQLFEVESDMSLCYIYSLFTSEVNPEVKVICETYNEFKGL